MFSWRLYRAALTPLLPALAIAAFSFSARPPALTSSLAPDAFEGTRAMAELNALVREFPHRRPGSSGDDALAARVAGTLSSLGSTAGGGFTVRTHRFRAQTIDGQRTLETVIAERPGSTGATPIVIMAHRDAAGAEAGAELSGTAALLELARVLATRETERTIILVSTSGGSGGAGGAADYAANRVQLGEHGPLDGAIVLGDVAGSHVREPSVVPFSTGAGSAPLQLQRTVQAAITLESASQPGEPSLIGQLAHLAFPFTVGEQGPLNASGIPAVLVQVSGERGPSPHDPLSEERLEDYGRAVLSAVDALDTGPNLPASLQSGLVVQRQTVPAWALRLLVAALLLAPLVLAADGLARARRRWPQSRSIRGGIAWTLACALPFLAVALFVRALGASGVIGLAPRAPIGAGALPFDASAVRVVLVVALAFALAWLVWPLALRWLGVLVRPQAGAAGLGLLCVLLADAIVVWILNPYAALLIVPALHLWLLIVSPELRPGRRAALGLVVLGLIPLVGLVVFYAHALGFGPGQTAWASVLLLAGGYVGLPAALLWSVGLGCAAAAAILAVAFPDAGDGRVSGEPAEVTIRGPLSYAGPGSLGGTESALRP